MASKDLDLDEESKEKATRFKEKHSLDSDEEDDNAKYDVLAEDDIEGQEEATIDFDDEIQITPFNMREELEEGHFDTDGTYIFDKSKEIHDNWIDNIDWVKVKHQNPEDESRKRPFAYSDDSDDESDEEKKKSNSIQTYEEIMKILKEGEMIGQAIRRLGKNKSKIPTASQKWKNKKLKASGKAASNQEEIDKAVEEQKQMLRLTELCDKLVQQGLIDIYETPYERIQFTLKQLKEKDKKSKLTIADGMEDDDALDMFADDFDSKEAEKIKPSEEATKDSPAKAEKEHDFLKPKVPESQLPTTSSTATSSSAPSSSSSSVTAAEECVEESHGVLWEYKIDTSEGGETKGPYTTSQMITWAEDGTFGDGVFCRKYKSGSQFYSSNRLDFELYE